MGDRGNIAIVQHPNFSDPTKDRGIIFFYGHWSGYRLEQSLTHALEHGRDRWGDESYMGRIIFCQFVAGDLADVGTEARLAAVLDTISFGISTYLTDNEYPILVVDDRQQKVFKVTEGVATGMASNGTFDLIDDPENGESFDDFIFRVGSEVQERV